MSGNSSGGAGARALRPGAAVAIVVATSAALVVVALRMHYDELSTPVRLETGGLILNYACTVVVFALVGSALLGRLGRAHLGWSQPEARASGRLAGWAGANAVVLLVMGSHRGWPALAALEQTRWLYLAVAWLVTLAMLCVVVACVAGAQWRRALTVGAFSLAAMALLSVPVVHMAPSYLRYSDDWHLVHEIDPTTGGDAAAAAEADRELGASSPAGGRAP